MTNIFNEILQQKLLEKLCHVFTLPSYLGLSISRTKKISISHNYTCFPIRKVSLYGTLISLDPIHYRNPKSELFLIIIRSGLSNWSTT